jgi:predicted nucleic acid-binding protein
MATRYVVDTNVLVYALDRREPEKRERAREVLRRISTDSITISGAPIFRNMLRFGLLVIAGSAVGESSV